jgi:adenosine kinase
MSNNELVVCGSIAIDRIMNFSGSFSDLIDPSKLNVLSLSILVDSLKIAEGGTGGNIAYNLACLGEQPNLIGSIGHDGNNYIERLKGLGVNVENVWKSEQPTASFSVLTDSLNNQVGGFYPGAMGDSKSHDLSIFEKPDVIVCVSADDPRAMLSYMEKAKSNPSLKLIYDPGQQVNSLSKESLRYGLEVADILILNEYELAQLCNITAVDAQELSSKIPVVITTYGENGCELSGKAMESPLKIGIATARQTTDPTGAGDGFRAGFIYGYQKDWPLETCCQLGACVASFVVEEFGPQVELNLSNIKDRFSQTFNKEVILDGSN